MPPFQLTPQQISLLIYGTALAVSLYVVVKLIQWVVRRVRQPKFRKRPATKSPRATPAKATPTPQVTATTPAATPARETRTPELVGAVKSESGWTAEDSQGSTREAEESSIEEINAGTMAGFWSVEPKFNRRKNLFEDAGVEYPYATGEDYRFGSLTPAMAELVPTSEEGRRTGRRLVKNAGYFEPHAWENFTAIRYLGIILPILLFGVLLVIAPEQFESYFIAGLVIGPALGWALPALILRSRAAERLRQIELAMPDMLDLLNMCVSQGMTVTHSLSRISREFANVYPALSKELRIVSDQAQVGSLAQALENFSDRVDVPEVHSFTSLLIQTEQMGTSVSEALAEYSDGMRENQRQRADEKANAATFKLLFPTVLCLMPAVFLLLMGPALIELNRFFSRGGIQGLNQQANEVLEQQADR